MPPRFAYWTIVAGGLPTAFRAVEREELLPTFNRLKEKHPDAEMKYFARGRLWASQDEARQEAEARRAAAAQRQSARGGTSRGRDWRPGGEHRDPRQHFKNAKKERNLEWRKQRFEHRQKPRTTDGAGAPPRPAERPEWPGRPPGVGKPQGQWRGRPPGSSKPQGEWRDRPPRPRNDARPPRSGEAPKPAPRPSKPPFRPPARPPFRPAKPTSSSGPPGRGRPPRGPSKDRRRS